MTTGTTGDHWRTGAVTLLLTMPTAPTAAAGTTMRSGGVAPAATVVLGEICGSGIGSPASGPTPSSRDRHAAIDCGRCAGCKRSPQSIESRKLWRYAFLARVEIDT